MPRDFEQKIKAGRIVPGMTFSDKVLALTARIPPGRVTTYGEIARALGTRASRAVGNALNQNPYAPVVPCHRVIGAGGNLGGFSPSAGGPARKRQMLIAEGVPVAGDKVGPTEVFVLTHRRRQPKAPPPLKPVSPPGH